MNIYSSSWPQIEHALVVFSGEPYDTPLIIWSTYGGYIHQDMIDGCADASSLSSEEDPPIHGFWVWEGVFQPLDHVYDSFEGKGKWRQPTSTEWSFIIKQQNPWGKDNVR